MKYNIGDKIRVLPNAVEISIGEKYIGKIGTIKHVDLNDYTVLFEDGYCWSLTDETCEIANDRNKKLLSFSIKFDDGSESKYENVESQAFIAALICLNNYDKRIENILEDKPIIMTAKQLSGLAIIADDFKGDVKIILKGEVYSLQNIVNRIESEAKFYGFKLDDLKMLITLIDREYMTEKTFSTALKNYTEAYQKGFDDAKKIFEETIKKSLGGLK